MKQLLASKINFSKLFSALWYGRSGGLEADLGVLTVAERFISRSATTAKINRFFFCRYGFAIVPVQVNATLNFIGSVFKCGDFYICQNNLPIIVNSKSYGVKSLKSTSCGSSITEVSVVSNSSLVRIGSRRTRSMCLRSRFARNRSRSSPCSARPWSTCK